MSAPARTRILRRGSRCAALLGVRRAGPPAPTSARREKQADQLDRDQHVRRLRRRHAVHHQVGRGQDQVRGRLLHRRRRHHRLPERPGDRRRLHVGGVLPRHLGGGDGRRLRRADLLDRLPGRLAGGHLPARRAAAQPGQVHLRRRRRVPLRADAGARLRRVGHAGGRRLLPDRADGRRRPADQAAVRPGVLDRGRHRRRADDGLRAVRRHDRDHLGADHQGLPAARPARPSWRSWCCTTSASAPRRCSPRRSRSRPASPRPRASRRPRRPRRASRSWARAASSRTRSRPSASAWR